MTKANFPNESSGQQRLFDRDADANFLNCFLTADRAKVCTVMDIFTSEIATIPYAVSSTPMGMIRLQWWHDEIAKIYAHPTHIPIVPLLADLQKVITEYHIPQNFFDGVLSAHSFDINGYDGIGEDVSIRRAAFMDYINTAHVPLLLQKADMAEEDKNASLPLAQSYAIIRILKSAAFAAAHGRCILPDVSVSAFKPENPVMRNAIGGWIDAAEKLCATTPRPQTRYLRAHAALVRLYCAAWKAAKYDPFHITPIPFKELRVWWHSR